MEPDELVLKLLKSMTEKARDLYRENAALNKQLEEYDIEMCRTKNELATKGLELKLAEERLKKYAEGHVMAKRLAFYEENGKCKIELQRVTPVKSIADGIIDWEKMPDGIEEKDAYLIIFFHRPLDKEELFDLYAVLAEYGIIKMTREEIDDTIAEDLENQPTSQWELKCNFHDALECAIRLGDDILFHDHAVTFQISNEPTNRMKKWLEWKEDKKVIGHLAGKFKVNDFDTEYYRRKDGKFDYFDSRTELIFISDLIFEMVDKGATDEEIRNIVMWSMVVIDAKKKQLDWKKACEDFKVMEIVHKYSPDVWDNDVKDEKKYCNKKGGCMICDHLMCKGRDNK